MGTNANPFSHLSSAGLIPRKLTSLTRSPMHRCTERMASLFTGKKNLKLSKNKCLAQEHIGSKCFQVRDLI